MSVVSRPNSPPSIMAFMASYLVFQRLFVPRLKRTPLASQASTIASASAMEAAMAFSA